MMTSFFDPHLIDPALRRNRDTPAPTLRPAATLRPATSQWYILNTNMARDSSVDFTNEDEHDLEILGGIERELYPNPDEQHSNATGRRAVRLNTSPTLSLTVSQAPNSDTNNPTADSKAPPKRKSKSRPGVNPPYKLRREWGLYQIALTEQELSQIRDGYHLPGMRLESFQSGANGQSGKRARVRLTLAEFAALKKLRSERGDKEKVTRVQSEGPTHEDRVKASEILEEYLRKKVAECRTREDARLRRMQAGLSGF